MAEFNSCSNLTNTKEFAEAMNKYKELLKNNEDPLAYMLKMQYMLQIELSEKRKKNNVPPYALETIGQKFDWLRENKQAFDDEYREMIDALPGMSLPEKDRSAVWKKWKTKYDEIRSRKFSDLSDDDLKELKFELVDSFHFYMNMFFALEVNAEELFVYYYTKNAENYNRVENGY